MAEEHAELTEEIITATESSNLRSEEGKMRAIERVAALGAAQRRLRDGATLVVNGVPVIDTGMELAALLVRAKYLHDHHAALAAKFLLAKRMRRKATRSPRPPQRDLSAAMAEQVIREWINDQCPKCSGSGLRGASMGGNKEALKPCPTCNETGRVTYMPGDLLPGGAPKQARERVPVTICCPACRGKRVIVERTPELFRLAKICSKCSGKGWAPPAHGARARSINVSLDAYERHWRPRFEWGLSQLNLLDQQLLERLHRELRSVYARVASDSCDAKASSSTGHNENTSTGMSS